MASAPTSVALPATTSAVADPKSWPLWWRLCMLGSLSWFVLMGQVMSASLPPMLGPIMYELHVSAAQASQLASWAVLALGFGNIWAVPAVASFGARYTIIFGLAIFSGGFFWQATSESYDSLLAARIIGGLGGGVVESMGPMIVVMLFPPEYLGRAMSVYTWSLGAGTVFGPLFAGYMIAGLGSWRSPQYLFGIMSILNMVGTILMFPEPIMNIRVRGEPPLVSAPDSSCGDEAPVISKKGRETISMENLGGERSVQDEQREFAAPPIHPASWISLWMTRSFFLRFTHHHSVSGWLSMAMAPYRMLAVPAVVLTVLLFGVSISTNIATSILVSLVFSQPPMLWSTDLVGLFNLFVLGGLCSGILIGGLLSDKMIASFTRRMGYHKPESALPLLLPLGIVIPLSTVLIGYGLAYGWHWAAIGVLWSVVNVNMTSGCTILISYATDIYAAKAIDIGVVVNVLKNAIAAGISFAVVDWWTKDGWYMFLAVALVKFLIFVLVAPLWIWGPKIAHVTKSWRWLQGHNVN
ncbi:Protein HOL1 [Colletotrichum siamense]|nr:Protein HOL1 [Colletotrichum siamense]